MHMKFLAGGLVGSHMNPLAMALLATTALAATPALAGNQLTNGSFEDGLNGWTPGAGDAGGVVVITNSSGQPFPTGAFGEVIPDDNALGNPGFDVAGDHGAYFVNDTAHPETMTQMVNIVMGTSYTFGFDVYIPFNGQVNPNDATLTATVGGDQFATFSAGSLPAGNWMHFHSAAIATSSGISPFVFEFRSFGVPAKDFVVDRVYFAATSEVGGIPEPATWALMIGGFGLAGAALRRRKALAASA